MVMPFPSAKPAVTTTQSPQSKPTPFAPTLSATPSTTGLSQDGASSPTFAAGSLSPKSGQGGGGHRSIGETFRVNPVNGTMSLTIPIHTSPSRSDAGPSLSLAYDSGAGNGPFGFGWRLSTDSISRKTSKGVPLYDDEGADVDVFLFSTAEDLVPSIRKATTSGSCTEVLDERYMGDFIVRRYRPRVEPEVMRIERWKSTKNPDDIYWRTISPEDTTTIFGRTAESRISDPGGRRIFAWLICESYDSHGNHIVYSYKPEDSSGLNLALACEQNRDEVTRSSGKYLKSIKYGNRTPNRNPDTWEVEAASPECERRWIFEVALDYGEHEVVAPTTQEVALWRLRKDPFSTYTAGFELRTYRLCRRLLIFHHLREKLGREDCLVSATAFEYEESPIGTWLTSFTRWGYIPSGTGDYLGESLPPIEFEYEKVRTLSELPLIEIESSDMILPITSGPRSQWLDLDGEGAPGLLSQIAGGGWYYQRNECAASGTAVSGADHWGPRRQLSLVPRADAAGGSCYFEDLNGNGRLDFVSIGMGGNASGYYERTEEGGWANFVPFVSLPNINLHDSEARRIDLTGDGRSDILHFINSEGELVWYNSLATEGFGPQNRTHHNDGPALLGSSAQENIFLADMSGDGLTDLVRLRDGDISYWPNLGHGRFGKRVVMDNSPRLDRADQFSHLRTRLVDVDGSGTTDLIYLPVGGGAVVYYNLAGNGWSQGHRLPSFPEIDQLSSVDALDLLGKGTACLCWASITSAGTPCLKYIDLMGGQKPHLMSKYSNGLGAEIAISYSPSTKYYLEDERQGRPWGTRIPFPVHCVDRLTVYDEIDKTSATTRYSYHDGYYDGFEREFRGFSMVEQWDAEDFSASAPADGGRSQRTAAHTKSWFHTGSFLSGSSPSGIFGIHQLPSSKLPRNLTTAELRDSYRALKGSLVRQEVFSDDNSTRAALPYAISEYNYEVVALQRGNNQRSGVFRLFTREQLTCNHERMMGNPRVQHEITLQVDLYGRTTKSLSISYGRLHSPLLDPEDRAKQEETMITYLEEDYTNAIDEQDHYRAPLPARSRKYRIVGTTISDGLDFDLLTKDNFSFFREAVEIPIEQEPSPGLNQKVLIAQSRTYYLSSDLSTRLAIGLAEKFSIVDQSYQLALTAGLLTNTLKRGTEQLIPGPEIVQTMQGAGYVDLDSNGQWWIPSFRFLYSAHTSIELSEARSNFYILTRAVDPFGNSSYRELDDLKILPIRLMDALENTTEFKNDYVALQPALTVDANGNQQRVAFDTFGSVVGTAAMGKATESLGDSLDGCVVALTDDELEKFLRHPLHLAKSLLGKAGRRMIYDPKRNKRGKVTNGSSVPTFEAEITWDNHFQPAGKDDRISVKIVYFNGLGNAVQEVNLDVQSGNTPRWRFSGYIIHDKEGQPVKQFNPFFAPSHGFQPLFGGSHSFRSSWQEGLISSVNLYDTLARPVGVMLPDNTWIKEVKRAWQSEIWDFNDTVTRAANMDEDVGGAVRALSMDDLGPSWYQARIDGQLGIQEQIAAIKAGAHANTPTVNHFDSMGRSILVVHDNGPRGKLSTRMTYDIGGNVLEIRDELDRVATVCLYSMVGHTLFMQSMDSGPKWELVDVMGYQMLSWDGRGNRLRTEYDPLRRPLNIYSQDAGKEALVHRMVYGEGQPDSQAHNLRKKMFRRYDQGGVETQPSWDFKGNLLLVERQFAKNYKTAIDWTDLTVVELEPSIFQTHKTYDALNRTITVTSPDQSVLENVFSVGGLLQSVVGNLRGEQQTTSFLTTREYDAHGRAVATTAGNTTTTEAYNKYSQRLARRTVVRREGNARTVVQSLTYTYDPVGNATFVRNDADHTVFFRNGAVEPHSEYTFDAVYRLVEATGREHVGQTGGVPSGPTGRLAYASPAAASEDRNMVRYVENYSYDEANNITTLSHQFFDPKFPGWTRRFSYESERGRSVSNRLVSTRVGNSTQNYSYDANGNMKSLPHLSGIRWDYANHLRSSSQQILADGTPKTTWYVYDAGGQRVRKVTERQLSMNAPGSPTKMRERLIVEGFDIYRKYGADGKAVQLQCETLHVDDGETRIALVEHWCGDIQHRDFPPKLIRFQLHDQLGSVSIELDETGTIISREEFTPFGSTVYHLLISEAPKRFRCSSKERDKENSLYYFGQRYYIPWLSRWMSPDPTGIQDGLNVYEYVQLNPIRFEDPDGDTRRERRSLRVLGLPPISTIDRHELKKWMEPFQTKTVYIQDDPPKPKNIQLNPPKVPFQEILVGHAHRQVVVAEGEQDGPKPRKDMGMLCFDCCWRTEDDYQMPEVTLRNVTKSERSTSIRIGTTRRGIRNITKLLNQARIADPIYSKWNNCEDIADRLIRSIFNMFNDDYGEAVHRLPTTTRTKYLSYRNPLAMAAVFYRAAGVMASWLGGK
ncbi:MAG: hypothetical protein M1839_004996, partial [Geoglossum umbratile]